VRRWPVIVLDNDWLTPGEVLYKIPARRYIWRGCWRVGRGLRGQRGGYAGEGDER